ncbi:hypothetical protein M9H77_13895 [Catharanthus roseus]|uniref:Uncharacterized protein n=1 Tax=Catharanthus roseus TaxID=4058 RepID=A0ACC0BLH8_CATRO|nr:hypothetical protein M9H77_13895 [Catharanthus roseus]
MALEEGSIIFVSAPSLPLQDRVAIVTGASRGIGRTIALHLASLGAKLVIIYASNSSQAELVAAEINKSDAVAAEASPRAIAVKANVSEPEKVKSLFDVTESAFNFAVNIMVNSAGIVDSKYPTVSNTSLIQRAINESPLDRLEKTEDIASVVGFLAGDTGEWTNGQIVRVNGGYV